VLERPRVDPPGGRLDPLARAGADRDARALGCQRAGDPEADPARRSGDERDPAVEADVHRHVSLSG
jgi:hypothetical protein